MECLETPFFAELPSRMKIQSKGLYDFLVSTNRNIIADVLHRLGPFARAATYVLKAHLMGELVLESTRLG